MYTDAKVLLRIELQGGTFIRESKATKIEWALTLGEIKQGSKKKIPEKVAEKVVRRGRFSHHNLVAKPAYKVVCIGWAAYAYMVNGDSYEPWIVKKMKKKEYMRLSREEKLNLHLGKLTEHYGGKNFSFQILE